MVKDDKGNVLLNFSKNMGLKESHETKVLAILEVLWLLYSSFHDRLIMESGFSNAISSISTNGFH